MKKLLGLLCLLCLLPLAEAAEEHPEYTARTLRTMDYFSTVSTLVIYDDFHDPQRVRELNETWAEIKAFLKALDEAISLSCADSDCARFSRLAPGESMDISPFTAEILRAAQAVNIQTHGLYDPTVSRLVDLYGFSPRFTSAKYRPTEPYDRPRLEGRSFAPPQEEYVRAFQRLVSFPLFDGPALTLAKTAPAVEAGGVSFVQTMDLGSIGKGYAVDWVMELLRRKGYEYGYFSCGGISIGVLNRAVASKGAPAPAQWGIALEKPRFSDNDEQIALRVFTADRCLSTSGDDEHAYFVDGQRYCHLIDPTLGAPINPPAPDGRQSGLCAASVYGDNAALCDAWSTAVCVAGLEQTLDWINSGLLGGYDLVLVVFADGADYCEIVTTFPPEAMEIVDPDHFRLACALQDGALFYTGTLLAQDRQALPD